MGPGNSGTLEQDARLGEVRAAARLGVAPPGVEPAGCGAVRPAATRPAVGSIDFASETEREARRIRRSGGRVRLALVDRGRDWNWLDFIHRRLDIGDSAVAEFNLVDHGARLAASDDPDVRHGVAQAWDRLAILKEHESTQGLWSLLDREAPEIERYEFLARCKGKRSIYSPGPPNPEPGEWKLT